MPYNGGMAVDRLSVTVPADLGSALRALAKARRTNVSTVVAEAIEREIRTAALDRALAAADDRFGAIDEELIARAEVELSEATKPRKIRRRRTSR
jgi:post-segregation antitoxin (ccd killing protein)